MHQTLPLHNFQTIDYRTIQKRWLQIGPSRCNLRTTEFYLRGLILHTYSEMFIIQVWLPLTAGNKRVQLKQNVFSIEMLR
jgi:hypothetical protein